jgi:hypothetical protein
MTLSIITFSRTTFNVKTLSIIQVSIMALSIMTLSKTTFNIKTLSIIALSIMTPNRKPSLSIIALSITKNMTLRAITLSIMTLDDE